MSINVKLTPELAELQRKVNIVKPRLVLDHPFFGMAVSKRPISYVDNPQEVPTAAMSARGQMYINIAWAAPLTIRELSFLLAHEAMHFMLSHPLRIKGRNHKAWNIACDKVINDILMDAGIGDPIEGGVYMSGARNMSAEQLYDEDDADGDGPGGIGNDVGTCISDEGKSVGESESREIQARTKIEVVQCAKAAKSIGKLPGSVERVVEEMVKVPTNWYAILEHLMQGKVRANMTFARPNKRFVHSGTILPSAAHVPSMGVAALVIDASGSVSDKEVAIYNGHINRILETCNPEAVHVIYCDTEVRGHDEFTADDLPVKIEVVAGGGTAFKPAFDYIDAEGIDPEVVIYLTDGYGNSNFTTTHDTIWLTTGTEDISFGTVIKFEE